MKKKVSAVITHRDKDLRILLEVSKAVSASLKPDVVNTIILKKAMWALKTDHASLFLTDKKGKRLILAAAIGFTKNEMSNIALLGSWERINYRVVKEKKPIIVNNLSLHPVFRKEKLPFSEKKLPLNSFLSVPLREKERILGVLIVSNKKGHRNVFTKDDKNLLMALANHVSIALLNARLYMGLEDLFLSTIASLANTIDAKDPYTRGHSQRVMKYSLSIAKKMGMPEDSVKNLRLAGLLHDVGKIGIKDAILGKKEKLTPEEAKIMRTHPDIGVNIISSIMGSKKFIRGISEHHEWINGEGYPKGLKGNQISLKGKIIAVADAYDALTTDRPYQKKFTSKEACLEIARSSGTQFDPNVVKAFLMSFSDENEIWQT